MDILPGHLDGLLGENFASLQYAGLTVQSAAGGINGSAPSAVSVVTTASTGPGLTPFDNPLTVTGVNDITNAVTFTTGSGSFTDYLIGYSTSPGFANYLLSTLAPGQIDPLLDNGQYGAANGALAVLSVGVWPPGTADSFTSTATPGLATLGIRVQDTTTSGPVSESGEDYVGPVAGVQSDYINVTSDSLAISAGTPGWFIHSGGGQDAITVTSGTNVLDGGTGSNFLTGGSGRDTFFVDDRGPTADIWSTVNNFHAGDSATVWGITQAGFNIAWADGEGATGFTGLTMTAAAGGHANASLTFAGFTRADIASGRLSISFGTDAASGSAYMVVQAAR
jgi:RTX calcium-binding nonapeptide repeat (4 copies)